MYFYIEFLIKKLYLSSLKLVMITQNIKILNEKITAKLKSVGKSYTDIKIIAVSKFNPLESISEAYQNNIINFGENRAQEFCDKAEKINFDVNWHFIGHLQSNKVKSVVEFADYIHSVDSFKLISEINKRAENINKIQKVLLEVKTSHEESKYGITDESEILDIMQQTEKLKNVDVVGLMTMAPFTDEKEIIKNCFKKLRLLKEKINSKGYNLSELSMGMTNDWEEAIEEGSTMLRIGSAIFGERVY